MEGLGFGTFSTWGLLYSHNGMIFSVIGFPAVRLSVAQPSMVVHCYLPDRCRVSFDLV